MSLALDLVLRSTMLLAVGLAAASLLRRSSAAVRHRVLTATVVASLVLPFLSLVAPRWSLPWMSNVAAIPPVTQRVLEGAPAASAETAFAVETAVTRRRPSVSESWLVGGVWLTGSLLLVGSLVAGLLRLRRLSRDSVADTSAWTEDARRIGAFMGLHRDVRVLRSSRPDLLVAWGWLRPTVLLPPRAAEWSAERRQVVLAHELAHLTRGDWAVQLGADVARALYWFNPLAWVLGRQLRVESECACDDYVLGQGIPSTDYALHLAAIAGDLKQHRPADLPAPAMARPTSLEGRVRAMLTLSRDRRPASLVTSFAIFSASALFTVAVAGAQTALVPVSGTIVDSTGRVLPDVKVSLIDPVSASRFEVRSDRAGRYLFAAVPPADYTLEFEQRGFQKAREPLRVASATSRDVSMSVGTIRETITVRGAAAAEPADLATRRANVRDQFEKLAALGTAPCRASGPPAVGGNILAPRKLIDVRAIYPGQLLARGIGGTVTLAAVIGTDGTVRDIADVHGPHPALEAAAADAVRDWQFSTTFLNCEPIEVRLIVTTNFVP